MARRVITAAFAVLVCLSQKLYAVPHLHPELYPDAKPCHVKHITPEMVKKYGSARAAVITPASGTKNVAVIIVRFPGADTTVTSGSSTIVKAGNFNTYINGMKDYYDEVSFNIFHTSMTFFGATAALGGEADATNAGSFLMPHNMEYYGCGDVDPGCNGVASVAPAGLGGAYLIRDAIAAARLGPPLRTVTFSTSTFDAVLVMHAGYGNETTNKNGDIWSAFYQETSVIGSAGGGFVDGATSGPYQTAHYTFATALMGACMMITGAFSGSIQTAVGYQWFFIIVLIASAPSILATLFAPFHHADVTKQKATV